MKIKSKSQTNKPSETTKVVASRTDRDNSGFDIRPGASASQRKRLLRSGVVVN
jgi:hypothetical protein